MGKKLMLKLKPVLSEKIWGYELWIASTHSDGEQKEFSAALGGDYPLLVKLIQADDTLSIQVHPDDELALKFENLPRGKTECWYVLSAKPDSKLVYGLNGKYSAKELENAIKEKKLERCLNTVEVHAGDFIFIPAGTVHAIGGGLRLLEVQQSSNITYRLYDWGRNRELHVDKGIKSIKNNGLQKVIKFPGKFDCEYFSLEEIDISGSYDFCVPSGKNIYDWQLVFALNGSGIIRAFQEEGAGGKPKQENFTAEDIFALAPGEKISLNGNAKLMRIACKNAPSLKA
ncbi:type I phosphomannose isomerase catalytic subunit [Treponema parvum]|uniref:type I phosphomannose isomerase catalytic subunit n=1 Tax=Treponema parvum TaxID=138851 RepID=UPI00211E9FCE|nr:type I phosphomannose isomerase catalytic subunit [Treponema parvum]